MIFCIDKIAENKIKAAIDRGELDDLPGQGKPLILDDESAIPVEYRAGFRMLKNAGYVPVEISLRTEIFQLEKQLQRIGCENTKVELTVKLALLKSRLWKTSGR